MLQFCGNTHVRFSHIGEILEPCWCAMMKPYLFLSHPKPAAAFAPNKEQYVWFWSICCQLKTRNSFNHRSQNQHKAPPTLPPTRMMDT